MCLLVQFREFWATKTDLLLKSIFTVLEMLKEMRWQFMNVPDKSLTQILT